jgi:hypothetical protein
MSLQTKFGDSPNWNAQGYCSKSITVKKPRGGIEVYSSFAKWVNDASILQPNVEIADLDGLVLEREIEGEDDGT